MSYRLISRAALTVNALTVEVEFRSYPLPKTAAKLPLVLDGSDATFQLTGGKGRGDEVKCYMYTTVNDTTCFALIPSEFHATMKAGKSVDVRLMAKVAAIVQPMDEEDTQESSEDTEDLDTVEETVKKTSRRNRKEKVAA